MRLLRVSTNTNKVITSLNNNVLKLYTKVAMEPVKFNKKPFTEIYPNLNVPKIMDDVGSSMQVCFHDRPYKIYYIANEFHPDPKLIYMRHWIDARKEEIKGLCIMEYIDYEQINFAKHKSKTKMDELDLDFMFILCESLNSTLKHF